ncbi:MAG: LysE family translocator [bacterium]|nr:LysE family translocator [bacterium]
MFEIKNYTSFVIAVAVFQLIPGPGTIAILNATVRNGVLAGGAGVLGTIAGDFVFMVAAVSGLAAIMYANPFVLEALQWFGAVYLVWMGLQLLRAQGGGFELTAEPKRSPVDYFRQAFAVSLSNPKVILFFVSFFPLFLAPNASMITLGVMMVHITVLSLLYQGLLVLLGNRVARGLRKLPSAKLVAIRLAGMALVGLGIKLAAFNR